MWKTMNTTSYTVNCLNQGNVIVNNIRDRGLDTPINYLLHGNSDFAYDVNCTLFAAVHKYIIDTRRFV